MRRDEPGPTRMAVPYYAQWATPALVPQIVTGEITADCDPLWRTWGAATKEEYTFWSWRTCGVACLRMVLDFALGERPTAKSLKDDCLSIGAYVMKPDYVHGLVYSPFVEYVHDRWNMKASVETELRSRAVAETVSMGSLVMLSVHPSIRNPACTPLHRGGHLVLVVGQWRDGLLLHNPSGDSDSQQYAPVTFEALERFSAGRGVVFEVDDHRQKDQGGRHLPVAADGVRAAWAAQGRPEGRAELSK